ncbi:uncharacterized protein LOC144345855 [Saccoglossus kowalevskii]
MTDNIVTFKLIQTSVADATVRRQSISLDTSLFSAFLSPADAATTQSPLFFMLACLLTKIFFCLSDQLKMPKICICGEYFHPRCVGTSRHAMEQSRVYNCLQCVKGT